MPPAGCVNTQQGSYDYNDPKWHATKLLSVLRFTLGEERRNRTFSAFRRACSSSRAACFSLSSTLVKDIPVLAREETALESVLALSEGTATKDCVFNHHYYSPITAAAVGLPPTLESKRPEQWNSDILKDELI